MPGSRRGARGSPERRRPRRPRRARARRSDRDSRSTRRIRLRARPAREDASSDCFGSAFHHVPPSVGSIARPRHERWRRSFVRASCSVLYNAPRVVSRRSASTSIGTPLSATATSTVRWCGVSGLHRMLDLAHAAHAARLRARASARRPRTASSPPARAAARVPATPAGAASPPPRRARTCTPTS